jgi:hypothetical protein
MKTLRQGRRDGLALAAGLLSLCGFGFLAQCGSSQGSLPPSPTDSGASSNAYVLDGGLPDVHVVEMSPPRTACTPSADPDAGDGGGTCPQEGQVCCDGFCTDPSKDPNNCGSCGNACGAAEFCTGTQCMAAIVANVCGNAKATVVNDEYVDDNDGGSAIGAALAATCKPATMVTTTGEDGGTATYPLDGRPNTGVGNTFVVGGGSFGHVGVGYLEATGEAPLYPQVIGDTYNIIERSTGKNAVSMAFSSLNASYDFFYVETAVEPVSGTFFFGGIGALAPGTLAAGYYISQVMMPHIQDYTKQWYLYEWLDTNKDQIPNAADTFTLIASAP